MKRRSFIGASIASALAAPSLARKAADTQGILRMPSGVFARVEGNDIALLKVHKGLYAKKGIEVRVVNEAGIHRILVRAPSAALEEVRFEWPSDAPLRVLNDHWERTYGDVAWQKPTPDLMLPWYFLEERRQGWAAFGVKTGASSFAHWLYADGKRHLVLDTRTGGVGV